MLKIEDISKLAKECNLAVNVDIEYDIDTPSIYYTYSLLLELRDRFELVEYFNAIYNNRKDSWNYPEQLNNDRSEEILEELLKMHVIDEY